MIAWLCFLVLISHSPLCYVIAYVLRVLPALYGTVLRFMALLLRIMIFTSVTYLFLQGPGLYLEEHGADSAKEVAAGERPWALAGAVMCFVLFAGYMRYQAMSGASEEDAVCLERRSSVTQMHIGRGDISLRGALKHEMLSLLQQEGALRGEAAALKGGRSKALKKLEVRGG